MGEVGTWIIESTKTVMTQIGGFLVKGIIVIVVLLIGWFLARIFKYLITKLLKTCKLDYLSEKIELDDLLAKGGIPYTLSELIGIVFYWVVLLIAFVVSMHAIELPIASDLLNRVVLYIPNIIAGIFILILGMFIATLLRNIVQTAASNAGVAQAKILAKVVEIIVVVFAIMVALEQLGIAPLLIERIVSIFLASLGLAFGLAFGLGCQEQAKKFLSDTVEKFKSKK
jgi:small-conductance mechanosensitive channel